MKKIKEIQIVFENCEVASLNPSMFETLLIEGIRRRHWINCFQYKDGEDYEGLDCERFYIEINKNGQKLECSDSNKSLTDRITEFSDITHIILVFNGGEKECITVPWRGNYMTNEAQKIKKNREFLLVEINRVPKTCITAKKIK